jgi:putative peptidoglycan lipid II flippase
MAESGMVKNIFIVSGTTVISRILGYLRDLTITYFFGISEVGAAFLVAFSLPNLFRRLLGEGALTSAMVPILSSQCATHGKFATLRLFSYVIRRLAIILCFSLALAYGTISIAERIAGDKWALILSFASALLPYMVFICLSAMCAATLNVLGRFFIASINQVWINISMILSLLIGGVGLHLSGISLARCLICGVLIGGIIQLAISMLALVSLGWGRLSSGNPGPNSHDLGKSMGAIWRLFLPGVFGASIEQLNILITRAIAYGFAPLAVTSLYVAVRLTELPMGIFGAAIVTVFFPAMAKSIGPDFSKSFGGCLMAMVWILLPSAVGLFFLRSEILCVLFQRGNFSADDVRAVAPIVTAYCGSMAFSGVGSLLIRGFHSRKDTKTPALVGAIALLTNASLALVLAKPFGPVGLAMAVATTAILQSLCLLFLFTKKTGIKLLGANPGDYVVIFLGNIAVAAIVATVKFLAETYLPLGQRRAIAVIFSAITLAVPAYLLICRKLTAKVISRKI